MEEGTRGFRRGEMRGKMGPDTGKGARKVSKYKRLKEKKQATISIALPG
jgi:hypothetical protein